MSYSPILPPAEALATTQVSKIDIKEIRINNLLNYIEQKTQILDKLTDTQRELALLKKENTSLKAELCQIDFISTPQESVDTELQRLKQRALLKYNNLENTPDDESRHVARAHLEYQAMVAAEQTYLTFLSLPDECDDW